MLALSLEKISQASPLSCDVNLDVRIYVDTCDPALLDEFEYVRDQYYPEAHLFRARPHAAAISGTWNILNSLREGYLSGSPNVFLIEEDVLVVPDFFNWSLAQRDCFCTCGRRLDRLDGHGWGYFTNPGACFPRESLGKVVEHIEPFLAGGRAYLDQTFGKMDEASDLDDGLVRRVIRRCGGAVCLPETPKVAHIGFQFYRKIDRFMNDGNIVERIAKLRVMLQEIKPTMRYAGDLEIIS